MKLSESLAIALFLATPLLGATRTDSSTLQSALDTDHRNGMISTVVCSAGGPIQETEYDSYYQACLRKFCPSACRKGGSVEGRYDRASGMYEIDCKCY